MESNKFLSPTICTNFWEKNNPNQCFASKFDELFIDEVIEEAFLPLYDGNHYEHYIENLKRENGSIIQYIIELERRSERILHSSRNCLDLFHCLYEDEIIFNENNNNISNPLNINKFHFFPIKIKKKEDKKSFNLKHSFQRTIHCFGNFKVSENMAIHSILCDKVDKVSKISLSIGKTILFEESQPHLVYLDYSIGKGDDKNDNHNNNDNNEDKKYKGIKLGNYPIFPKWNEKISITIESLETISTIFLISSYFDGSFQKNKIFEIETQPGKTFVFGSGYYFPKNN